VIESLKTSFPLVKTLQPHPTLQLTTSYGLDSHIAGMTRVFAGSQTFFQ